MATPRTAKASSLSAPVEIKCLAQGDESAGPPTFSAVAYSGGRVPGYTTKPRLEHDYIVDLAGMTVDRHPLANLEHDSSQRIGHLTAVENDGKQVQVAGVFSAATTHAEEVIGSHRKGYPWEVSQEANLSRIEKLAAGKTTVVNGQTVTGPIYIARKSTFTGLAFAMRGADDGNSVSIAATAAGENQMNEFDTWLAANDFDPDTMTEKQKVKMQAAFDAEKSGGVKTVSPPSKLSELAAAERGENERVEVITRMSHKAMKENPMWIDAIAEMAQRAISDKTGADSFELELLRGTRYQTGTFRVAPRSQEPDSRVMEAALSRAVGLPNLDKHYSEQVLDTVERDPRLRNFSLQQVLMRAACSRGYDGQPGERITGGNLKRVLKYAFPDEDGPGVAMRAAGQFSTVSLPGIFGNVANKEIAAGYMEEDGTWREISKITSSTDFKASTTYRLTDSLEYEELPKGGEIKHGTLGEESYTRQLKTYAKMLGLDRQDIINDDLSAFDDLRTRLGRGGARKFNNVFWTAFLNNSTFFTTARGNYIEGATTNLGTDGVGLTAAVAAFKRMESVDGKRIGGQPTILLVPPELEFIADRLYTGGGAQYQTAANTNPFAGKYRPVVVPWLSDADFTGYSTTAFYVLRAPTLLAAMVVSFLNGNQSPMVESTDADFNTLGILFRGVHDFSADKAEYLAGLKSKGAA